MSINVEYSIIVRFVRGAYFVQAMEFDDEGVYRNINDALDAAEINHGELFVSGG